MINWVQPIEEHEEEVQVATEEDRTAAKDEVKNHVHIMEHKVKDCLLSAFKSQLNEIQEENFEKMADGKLIKAYSKLDSYNKKLALI
jgi:hypothetical protein